MCGIAGVLDAARLTPVAELAHAAERMAATLAHRGPDDEGVWTDPAGHVALGHRRLAVLDPSPLGGQPMTSTDGRYTVVFNGEIYNFRELRRTLRQRGQRFRGDSDTEVLVAAISEWGVDEALERSNGMFALGVWDARERTLQLARDRLGEKPLYYGWFDGTLLFGSELCALRAHPSFVGRVDPEAVALYLRYTHVPAPHSIYAGVRKLLPGYLVTVQAETASVEERRYWSLEAHVLAAKNDPFQGGPLEAADHLDELIRDSVRLRLESDVPLGAFLSGGIDSSTVVAAMQAEGRYPARTFTVSFADASYDEAHRAAKIARHLGTDHTEIRVSPDDALAAVDRLPDLYDEPLADPSQLPTAVMCGAARRHVTVCLSGDGGDEVFGGYNRYLYGARFWPRLERVPRPLRVAAAHLLAVPSHRQLAALTATFPGGSRLPNVADKLQKLVTLLPANDEEDAYRRLVSAWQEPDRVLGPTATTATDRSDVARMLTDPISRMMLRDTLTALPDGMLVKVDRASMAVGLEVRIPLLDHRLVEFAWRLPVTWKIRNGTGKWLLRRVLSRYVPTHLTEAPKMGFDPPIGAWLRGPLREWAETLLAPGRLRDEGLFDPVEIRTRWSEHLRGRRNWDYALWTVLVYEAWRERHSQQVAAP